MNLPQDSVANEGAKVVEELGNSLLFLPLIFFTAVTGLFERRSDRARRYDEHMRKVSWWRTPQC